MSQDPSPSPRTDPVGSGAKGRGSASPVPAAAAPIALTAHPVESSRNLALGVFLVLVALPVAGVAFIWAPREAFVATSTSVLIALLVFLFFQLRLLSQRNGLFALLSAGLLVTLAVPILVKMGASSGEWAEWIVAWRQAQAVRVPESPGKTGTQPPRGPAEALAVNPSAPDSMSPSMSTSVPPKAPSGTGAPAPAASARTGSLKPAQDPPRESVEPKSSATTAAVNAVTSATAVNPEETVSERTTRLSKDEAVRRYPNLASVGSPEHSKYIHTYNEFKRMYKHEFFADPAWPLNLAELIAVKEGWKRADAAETRPVRSEPAPSAPPSDAAAREAALVRSERLSPGVLVPSPAGEEEVSVVEGAAGGDLSSLSRVFGLELPDADPANPNAPVVAESLQEVRRRYPLMAQAGTEENRLFKESYQEYERLRPDFFSNPRWPGRLADLLAKRMGWKRMDSASGGTERR